MIKTERRNEKKAERKKNKAENGSGFKQSPHEHKEGTMLRFHRFSFGNVEETLK